MILSRVLDDMADVRADAVTGEIGNLWLTPIPTHDKTLPAAAAIAAIRRPVHGSGWMPLSALFHTELAAFEALHGPWRGNIWTILRRTYVAAILTSLDGGAKRTARGIQIDSGAVGADQFHLLNQFPAGVEDTALLSYLFGCAHPHFLWNCLGHQTTTVSGDWLDG